FHQETTWIQAEAECQHHWRGAHLVSIHSDEENNMLAQYIKREHRKTNPIWIGLSDPQQNRCWRWSDHSPFTFRAWDKGQPNNLTGNEYCAGKSIDTSFQKWHDYPCDYRFSFICKRKPYGKQVA
ncbi:hypothetical protein G0U57_008066, partial [Chelydra serpentina]